MASPFVAEIRMVGFTFAPRGWAKCDGQILAISQNTALFSLLGTQYGGNGTSNFALPNLGGSAPLGQGQGPGLSQRIMGETGGAPTVTLTTSHLPQHKHTAMAQAAVPNPTPSLSPAGNVWAVAGARRGSSNMYASAPGTLPAMNAGALALAGQGQPHNNMSPYLCVLFVIALQGIFPQSS